DAHCQAWLCLSGPALFGSTQDPVPASCRCMCVSPPRPACAFSHTAREHQPQGEPAHQPERLQHAGCGSLHVRCREAESVLEQGPSSRCHATLVTLISISLLLQVVVGILLVVILWLNLNKVERQWRLDQPNSAATTLVFLTVGISVSIIAFGAHKAGFLAARASRNLL
uniref:Ninjurin 2 n=1 Tax=Microcebus murinus TaxID=30608 RepID=A0A8C5Y106_MICMU